MSIRGPTTASADGRTDTTAAGVVANASRTHFAQLDGLRGLAILSVMLYHFCLPHVHFHGREGSWWLQLAQGGWLGVDLFFVLSGFLITGILVETRTQTHYLRTFLVRRFLRIWPLYYASLVMLLVVLPLALPTAPPQLQSMQDKQIWFWLYGANWLFAHEGGFSKTSGGYFWSLAVEEQFYLVWPLVVYALSDRSLLRVSMALLGVSLLSRIGLAQLEVNTNALYTMTFTHLDGLAVGSCLALCIRSPQKSARVLRWLPVTAAFAAAGLVAVRLADGNLFYWSRHMATSGYSLAAILFGALLFWVISGRRTYGIGRLFSSSFMRQCGKYSYALYVVHVPVAAALFPRLSNALKGFEAALGYDGVFFICVAASFAASWLIALLSWNLFEKRILALKRYFNYEPPGADPPAVATDRSAARTPRD